LFEKYGLTPPKTWDDFLKDAATISSKESGFAGLGLTTKNGSVRTFQEFISFFFEADNGENPYKYDEAGKSAMVPMGPWIYSYRTSGDVAKKILEEETGVAPLPLPPGGVQATYLEVKPVSINAFSKDKKDAWDLVKLLTSRRVTRPRLFRSVCRHS
jgi:ABC-type glycerol-3-phosphate transport system substrate-binding protein